MQPALRRFVASGERRVAIGLGVILVSTAVTGCSPSSSPGGADATPTTAAATSTAVQTATGSATPGAATEGTPAPGKTAGSGGAGTAKASTTEPSAPGMPGARSVSKVSRGATPARIFAASPASPASLKGTVGYADGTSIRIVRIERGAQTAQGPGAFPGSGFAAVEIEVKAGKQPVDLSRVVVSALAGSPRVVVNPVYVPEAEARDFTGRIAAGAGGTARYAFAIESGAAKSVQLVVDLDDEHANAVFTGPLA